MENNRPPGVGIPRVSRPIPNDATVSSSNSNGEKIQNKVKIPDLNAEFSMDSDQVKISIEKLNLSTSADTFEHAMTSVLLTLRTFAEKFKGAPLSNENKMIVRLISVSNDKQLYGWIKATMKQTVPVAPRITESSPQGEIGMPRRRAASQAANDDGWTVDPRTGKKYKLLPGANSDSIKNFRKTGSVSLESMMNSTKMVEDFDVDNLNAEADIFLAHLRVPPSKEEIARLREEKAQRLRKQQKEYEELNQDYEEKDQEEIRKALGGKL